MSYESRKGVLEGISKIPIYLIILLEISLLGCSAGSPIPSPSPTESISQVSAENQGQSLPIGAKAMMGGEVIQLEVAKTPDQQMTGLMYRTALPQNQGMLFVFEQPQAVRFWMKNVKISLDMIFLKDGEIKAIASNVPPCSSEPCPTYGPNTPIEQVIELRGGRATDLKLKKGDRITIEYLNTP